MKEKDRYIDLIKAGISQAPTADLIAELEKRKPSCYECANYPKAPLFNERICQKCIWPGWLGKDNFKPKEDR